MTWDFYRCQIALVNSHNAIIANIDLMNYSICLGFSIWYSLMPKMMLYIWYYDYYELLSPEFLKRIKDSTQGWSSLMIESTGELSESIKNEIMLEPGCSFNAGASTSIETVSKGDGLVDSLELVEPCHKTKLTKLIIACLLTCLLSNRAYATVIGNGQFQLSL